MGDKEIKTYRFCRNYYFMAGDKTVNSQDSRYWGLLPEEFIVGKASFVWKSKGTGYEPYEMEQNREKDRIGKMKIQRIHILVPIKDSKQMFMEK